MEIILTSIVIGLVAIILWVKQVENTKTANLQKSGIVQIRLIKQVIFLAQQHRGLMAAWLNGDEKIEVELNKRKQKILAFSKEIDFSNIANEERWLAFKDHWARLMTFDNTENVLNSFEQHTKMIRNLAYFLEDTAEKTHLTSDYIIELPKIGFVWRELVLVAENVGQSRAIGTAVATRKFCSSVDKIRLNFLTQTIKTTTKETLNHLSSLPDEQRKHNKSVELATGKINQLAEIILNDLVSTNKITVDHKIYYELATETIELLNNVFDHQVEQIESVI